MTRYSTPFREGDDALAWLRCELPTWVVHPDTPGLYRAASPTYAIDGITISAPDPVELVERVRAFERMVAMAAGVGGRMPVGRVLGGQQLDNTHPEGNARPERSSRPEGSAHPEGSTRLEGGALPEGSAHPKSASPQKSSGPTRSGGSRSGHALSDPTGLGPAEGPAAVQQAKSRGYSGTPCNSCGSLHTRYSGTCLVCDNCGATSGCS